MAEAPLSASLPASFRKMREAGELVDVVLIFGQTRVPCHRVVLAGTCDYFRHIFLTNNSKRDVTEVKMNHISASTGFILVKYLYAADIELNRENAEDLLFASNMLSLKELMLRIEAFLVEEIDVLNCVEFMNLSCLCRYDLATLNRECKSFMKNHIDEIVTKDVICGLDEVDELDVADLLMLAELHETRFSLLQKWTSSDETNESLFMDFMQHINLTRCSKHFVKEIVMSEQLMKNPDGTKLIQDCLLSAAHNKSCIAVGGEDGDIWLCDDEQHWEMIAKPPTTAKYYSACASPGGFFLTGGDKGCIGQEQCYEYHINGNMWKTLPPLSTARFQHASSYNDHTLYVVGGMDGACSYSRLDSVETLDMESMYWYGWSNISRLPQVIPCPLAVCALNSLFVFAGCDVYEYPPSEQTWRPRASVPERCDRADVVCFDDFIFLFGGYNRISLRFNPRDDSWLSLERPQFDHVNGRSLVWKDKILLCGGDYDDSIEEYSPATDQWSTWTLKLPTKSALAFALRY